MTVMNHLVSAVSLMCDSCETFTIWPRIAADDAVKRAEWLGWREVEFPDGPGVVCPACAEALP